MAGTDGMFLEPCSHRPVLIKFRNAVAASGVLRKSQGLRTNKTFEKVFISPDRTVAQRVEHRLLVTVMKKRAAEDRNLRFFIRDGQVQSVERDQGTGDWRGGRRWCGLRGLILFTCNI